MTYTAELVIEVRELTKRYGDHTVLAGITLEVGHGIHALLGPNGAGKTTLVNILTTLSAPDSGSATVLGLDTRRDAAILRRRISVTGQFTAVDDDLTGVENLTMLGRLHGLPKRAARDRAVQLLDGFDLAEAMWSRVATYSGGMRRRLDLAASLIRPPGVLFLDEPTTGLDTRSRLTLWEQIRSLAAGGTIVFLTTQYLEEADQLADSVAVLDGGRIVEHGSPAYLKSLVGGDVLRIVSARGEVVRESPTDGSAASLSAVAAMAVSEYPDAQVELVRPTLDDVFLALTGTSATTRERPEVTR